MKNHKHPPGRRGFLNTPQLEDKMYLYLLKVLVNHFTCYLIHLSGYRGKTSPNFTFQGWCQSWILLYTVDPPDFVAIKSMKNILHWSDYLSKFRCYLKYFERHLSRMLFSKTTNPNHPNPLAERQPCNLLDAKVGARFLHPILPQQTGRPGVFWWLIDANDSKNRRYSISTCFEKCIQTTKIHHIYQMYIYPLRKPFWAETRTERPRSSA